MRPCRSAAAAAPPLSPPPLTRRHRRPAAVEHVSGDDGSGDVFHVRARARDLSTSRAPRPRTCSPRPPAALSLPQGGDDVAEPPTAAEARGHETLAHHKHRLHMEGRTDAEILRDEGADLPHATRAGSVELPGAAPQ